MPGGTERLDLGRHIERLPSGLPEEHSTETPARKLQSSSLPNNEPLDILRSPSTSPIRSNRLPARVRSTTSEDTLARAGSTPGTPILAPTPLRPGSSASFHLGTRRWSSPVSRPEAEDSPDRGQTVSPLSIHPAPESVRPGASNDAHGIEFDSSFSRSSTPVSDRFISRPHTPASEAAGHHEEEMPFNVRDERERPLHETGAGGHESPRPETGRPAGGQYGESGEFATRPPQPYQPPMGPPPGFGGPRRYPSAFDPANPANGWANTPQLPMYNNPAYNSQGYPQQNSWMDKARIFIGWGTQLGTIAIDLISSVLQLWVKEAEAVRDLSKK